MGEINQALGESLKAKNQTLFSGGNDLSKSSTE